MHRSVIILFAYLSTGCANAKSLKIVSDTVPSLTGEWIITTQTFSPLILPPHCKPIQEGVSFKFTQNTLEVYLKSSVKSCDVYPFKITDNTISFIKKDMIWLCTYELSANNLKLKSDNFFTPDVSGQSLPVNKQPPPTNEIVVILIKKTNQPN